ncbi:uncharacterized protein LOC144791974 [Lissotriton helveticus]
MANSDRASVPSEQKFKYFKKYSAKVTDKESKQLRLEDRKVIAKQIPSNNKDTLDIHLYAVPEHIPENYRADSESSSILKKILEDAGSRFILEKLLGDTESLSTLQKFMNGSGLLARDGSASQSALYTVASWNQLKKLPVAFCFTGTNLYLADGEQSSLSLEEKSSEELKEISGSNTRFIFWQGMEQSMQSFESGIHKDFYICTSAGGSTSPVELRTGPELQQAISQFRVSD